MENKRGYRAIDVRKMRGSAIGKKSTPGQNLAPNHVHDLSRKFVFRGVRPAVTHRRSTPPTFLPNYDVPAEVEMAIRNGTDLLAMLPNLPEGLNERNYVQKMSALLYCEEVAEKIQIGQFTMEGVKLEHIHGDLYKLDVPGLKLESPKLVEADRIVIHLDKRKLTYKSNFKHLFKYV
jgi:hypothetical protein